MISCLQKVTREKNSPFYYGKRLAMILRQPAASTSSIAEFIFRRLKIYNQVTETIFIL